MFFMNNILHICILVHLFIEQWTDLLHLYNVVWESSSIDVCQIGVPTALLLQLQPRSLRLQLNNEAFYFLFAFRMNTIGQWNYPVLQKFWSFHFAYKRCKIVMLSINFSIIFKNGYFSVATLYYIFFLSTNHCMAVSLPKFRKSCRSCNLNACHVCKCWWNCFWSSFWRQHRNHGWILLLWYTLYNRSKFVINNIFLLKILSHFFIEIFCLNALYL